MTLPHLILGLTIVLYGTSAGLILRAPNTIVRGQEARPPLGACRHEAIERRALTPTPVRVAVVGAGLAGRAHAAAYRNAVTMGNGGIEVELLVVADANFDLAATTLGATGSARRSRIGRRSLPPPRSTR